MFARFMPKEVKFFELFNAHAELIARGGRQLVALVADLEQGPDALARHVQAIDQTESAADQITHETMALLHTSFNTPLDRDEIHQLITRMDDVLDLIQDFSEAMFLYDIRSLTQEARQLSDLCAACCERVSSAVLLLHKMDNAPAILKLCHEIDQLESAADRAMRTGITKLFRDEPDVRQLIKLKGIYELLESVTDRCEDVASVIEGIVLENS
jgi:predicted phosphate transport protein (TIGR00153 family)